mmetsp:Transcript_7926/g.16191  ORF Transcript_7926/g.16191 Transcript_7926/m.16191 type:complete len:208 (+) Transcript_7926:839-1462(+)
MSGFFSMGFMLEAMSAAEKGLLLESPKGFGSNFWPGAAKGEAAGLSLAFAKGLGLGLDAFAKGLAAGFAGELAAAKGLAGGASGLLAAAKGLAAGGVLAAAKGLETWSFGLLSSEKRSAGGGGSLLPAFLVCDEELPEDPKSDGSGVRRLGTNVLGISSSSSAARVTTDRLPRTAFAEWILRCDSATKPPRRDTCDVAMLRATIATL